MFKVGTIVMPGSGSGRDRQVDWHVGRGQELRPGPDDPWHDGHEWNQAVASATSAKVFTWDPILKEWEFAIATKGLVKGTTYVYTIGLNDGSTITFQYTTS